MNELIILGSQGFMGISIPVVSGGFGHGKKCMSDKTIAEIHGMREADVRRRITDNITRFKNIIDFIDLKSCASDAQQLLISLGYSQMQISKAEHIYILSERGYSKLIKIMDSDLAWEIHDKLMDEYFEMREVIDSSEQLKASLLLSIYNGGQEGVLASKQLTEIEVKAATTPLLETIEEQKPMVEFVNHVTSSSDTVDIGELAKIIKNEKIDIGRNRLFKWLRENKILMNNNLPYQIYLTRDWFNVIETTKDTAYGTKVFSKVLVTGKGQVGIIEKLRKEFREVV